VHSSDLAACRQGPDRAGLPGVRMPTTWSTCVTARTPER